MQESLARRLEVARCIQADVLTLIPKRLGSAEQLLDLAEFVGQLAWRTHTGSYAVPEVEFALRDLDWPGSVKTLVNPRLVENRTLHVVTECFAVGGHSRMVQRWIELANRDRHAVVLVRQTGRMQPGWLIPEGNDTPLIDFSALGVVKSTDRVSALLQLFDAASRVVLHIHPDDACSVAAAYQRPGLDIRLINHADHVAWLGAGLPVSHIHLRPGGINLSAERRGIDRTACDLLPIPITEPPVMERKKAREQLGIRESDVLLLTIARREKYLPIDGRSLLELFERALARPEVRLIAIGPDARHPVFAPLVARYGDKVQTLGTIPVPPAHRAAADIYVDSFPFGSATSMLESAVVGTPIVSYQPDYHTLGILYAESASLPRASYAVETLEAAHDLLEQLITQPTLRLEKSQAIRTMLQRNRGDGFQSAVTTVLDRPRPVPQAAWRGDIPTLNGLLDQVSAGLGMTPLYYQRLDFTRALSLSEQLRLRALRLRYSLAL